MRQRHPTCVYAPCNKLTVVEVTLPSLFSLPYSPFNPFLFALIGEERNGMSLSVMSALARLEMDPWQEAARLSELPKEQAAASLVRLIRRLPACRWDEADTRKIAGRLIEFLPWGDAAARPDGAQIGRHKKANRPAVLWLIVLALGAATLFGIISNNAQRSDDPGAFTAITGGVSSPARP